jgi:hypothetical protein
MYYTWIDLHKKTSFITTIDSNTRTLAPQTDMITPWRD